MPPAARPRRGRPLAILPRLIGRPPRRPAGSRTTPAPSLRPGVPPRLARLPGIELPGGLRVAEAVSRRARLLGLARLEDLPEGWALHLPRCRSVHTFGMRFALDLVFLDGAGRAVRVDPSVPAGRVVWCRDARSVLETRAGEAERFLAAGAPLGTLTGA